ncbi:ATP binding protein, putative [Ricinus communis]|uniref:ATP binding protein, putative n=1 Tax=Ricinus communis TaxID=3988 RepID=B9SH56_RICCO|nr:ATP binding protein, putative [Ricinus communis]
MAEVVGGAFLSAFLQVLFDRIASREFIGLFKSRSHKNGQLKKLKTMLMSVNGILDDAEEKQITNIFVKQWLNDLKDVVYEADDCLDEIAYKVLRLELEVGSKTSSKDQVRKFFSFLSPFKDEIEAKLEEILERLEYLVKQKSALGLIMKEGIEQKLSSQKIPTTSLLDEYGIFGREDDKEAIIKLLVDDGNTTDLSVIPIVGMGGIGKTTLAQLLYNDTRVQGWFDLKGWIYVSKEFDVLKVTKDIYKAIGEGIYDTTTPDQLQLGLKKSLVAKRFFLVLDDVWNDKYSDWDILRRPLKHGAKGSKIVVTTRNESVARVMGAGPIHYLKELSQDDSWSLFVAHAFDDGNLGEYPNLEAIGREIVRKSSVLPLAAKLLGGLMHSRRKDVDEWEHILNSNMWGFPLGKKELICLWMADGFLIPSGGIKEMEELGEKYYQELVSRLPDVITTLYNLQTLYLVSCTYLVELPANFPRLINLRHLDIRCTQVQKMLLQMSLLSKLQFLNDFILGKHSRSSIKELGKIQCLRDVCICNLQNVIHVPEASKANLKAKSYLRNLKLSWEGDTGNSQHDRFILEQLEPHTKLEYLSIVGYNGPEFYGSTEKPFGFLEILSFKKLPSWHEWSPCPGAFCCLLKLYIEECPMLNTNALPGNLAFVTQQ